MLKPRYLILHVDSVEEITAELGMTIRCELERQLNYCPMPTRLAFRHA